MLNISRKNLISILLVICLASTLLFIPLIYSDSVYGSMTPAKASLSKSVITVPATMIVNKKFPLTLTGDRQSEKGTVEGETRYIPYSYEIVHSDGTVKSPQNLKPNNKGIYSYSIKFTVIGKKTVKVTWLHQKFQNGKWVISSKEKTKRSLYVKGVLKFNGNGGSVKTKTKYMKQKEKIGTLPKPTRTCYKFKGWYTKKTGGTKIKSSTKIKFTGGTKNLYAKWSRIKGAYKVSLHPNGGTVSPKSTAVVKGGKYSKFRSLPTPTRTNYNFVGWYTAKTGGSKIGNSTLVKKSSKHTLFARWQKVSTPAPTPAPTTNPDGKMISNYDSTAKSIIAGIGTQAKSQCAVYCMSYCTAIKDKIQVPPSSYLLGNLAHWALGGMNRKSYVSTASSTAHTQAMTEIKRQIDMNLPCIVRCTYGTSGEHWVAVVGYRKNPTTYSDLYVLDPSVSDVTQTFLFYDTKYYFPNDGYVGVATY